MIIEKTEDMELVKSILTAKELYAEIAEDGSPSIDEYEPDSKNLYLLAKKGDDVIGVFMLHSINSITYQAHINTLPQYWGERLDHFAWMAIDWVAKNTTALKMISVVPENCPHVIAATLRYGFINEGFSPMSIKRKGKIVGQFLFGLTLEK